MYHPFYGGAEVQAHLLARTLQSQGHEVTVLTMHFGETAASETLDGIPIVRVPRQVVQRGNFAGIVRAMLAAFLELRRLGPVDVVHMHGAPFLLIPILAYKKLYGTPVVLKMISGGVTARSTILMTSRLSWFNRFKRRLLKNVDVFVCLNDELADEVKGLVPNARCLRIPNGVDSSYWSRPESARTYKASIGVGEYKTAIYVGRLVPEKGVDMLLKVWKAVVECFPKAKLFIVGDGPLASEMRDVAAQTGIAGSITFAGARKDFREILFAMDAFLLFSPNEGMSNAMLEAMAAGVPIICNDSPGTSGVIQHMVNGIRITPGQVSEAAASICRIFEDPNLATGLAERARANVRSTFDISVTARQYEQLFHQLIRGVATLS